MTEGKAWGKKNSWLVVLLVVLILLLAVCAVVFLAVSGNSDKSNNDWVDEGESSNYEQVEITEDYETVIEVTNAEGSASTSAGGGIERQYEK